LRSLSLSLAVAQKEPRIRRLLPHRQRHSFSRRDKSAPRISPIRPGKHFELPPLPTLLKARPIEIFRGLLTTDGPRSVCSKAKPSAPTPRKVRWAHRGWTVLDRAQGSRPSPGFSAEQRLLPRRRPSRRIRILRPNSRGPASRSSTKTGPRIFRSSLPFPPAACGSRYSLFPVGRGQTSSFQLHGGIITHRASVKGLNTRDQSHRLSRARPRTSWWAHPRSVAHATSREVRFPLRCKNLSAPSSESDLKSPPSPFNGRFRRRRAIILPSRSREASKFTYVNGASSTNPQC